MMDKIQLIESGVVFNKEHHTYHLTTEDGGKKYLKGITSTLVKRAFPDTYKDVPEEVLRRAAVRGSAIHEKIEKYEADIDYSYSNELLSYLTIKDEQKLTHIASEYIVTDGEKYASAIDHVFVDADGGIILGDVKTTYEPHYDTTALQLSIYRRFFEMQNPGLKVKAIAMIWLKDEKSEWKVLTPWAEECLDELFAADAEDKPFDITSTYGDLPAKVADVEEYLANLEREVKAKTEELKAIKDGLCELMLAKGVKKFTTSRLSLCTVTPKPKKTFDSKRFQAEQPEVYEQYVKTSEVKPSVRLTVK